MGHGLQFILPPPVSNGPPSRHGLTAHRIPPPGNRSCCCGWTDSPDCGPWNDSNVGWALPTNKLFLMSLPSLMSLVSLVPLVPLAPFAPFRGYILCGRWQRDFRAHIPLLTAIAVRDKCAVRELPWPQPQKHAESRRRKPHTSLLPFLCASVWFCGQSLPFAVTLTMQRPQPQKDTESRRTNETTSYCQFVSVCFGVVLWLILAVVLYGEDSPPAAKQARFARRRWVERHQGKRIKGKGLTRPHRAPQTTTRKPQPWRLLRPDG